MSFKVPDGLGYTKPASTPYAAPDATATGADADLIFEVEARIEEVSAEGATPDVPPALIRTHLADAAASIVRRAPLPDVMALARDYAAAGSDGSFTVGTGLRVPLPAALARFVSVRLAGWAYAVDTLTESTAAVYRLAQNPLLAPSTAKPFAVMVPLLLPSRARTEAGAVGQALDAFPAPAAATARGHRVLELVCVAAPTALAVAAASAAMRDALLWEAAGRVLTGLRETERAGACFTLSNRALGA